MIFFFIFVMILQISSNISDILTMTLSAAMRLALSADFFFFMHPLNTCMIFKKFKENLGEFLESDVLY